jgi:WD40 repeat protein
VITLSSEFGLFASLAFGPQDFLYTIAVPNDGWEMIITKWDASNGKKLGQWSGPHTSGPTTAVVSPDGSTLAVGTHQGVIQLYNTETGQQVGVAGHQSRITSITFDPTGHEVRTADADGVVQGWDAPTGHQRSARGNVSPPYLESAGLVRSPDARWTLRYRVNPEGFVPKWLATVWDGDTGKQKYEWGIGGRVK